VSWQESPYVLVPGRLGNAYGSAMKLRILRACNDIVLTAPPGRYPCIDEAP
jgi:hypothetical protein